MSPRSNLLILFFLFLTPSLAAQELAPPEFSHEAGAWPDGIQIELSQPDEQAVIRYTLDGSLPTADSPLYQQPISFSDRPANQLMFIQTTPNEGANGGYGWKSPSGHFEPALVIRARVFRDGFPPSGVETRTYLNQSFEHTLPVISIVTDREHLFSDETGIYVPGRIYQQNGWNHNDAWGRPNANYHQRGVEWERPASIELIEPGQSGYFNQQIGIRIHGGGSRVLPQKAFRLYSRSDYGVSRFNYDLFERGETGYNRLILRNSGQDFYNRTTMFMDAIAHTLVEDLSFDTMDYRPFVVYVNGEYWGIKNLRERFDRHFLVRTHDLEEEEIDLLSNEVNAPATVTEGSADFYNSVLDSLESNSMEALGGMEFIERHFDVRNFAEYYASQIYFANIDWPGNNTDFWRHNGTPEGRGSPMDGRFRWMFYDLDFAFAHFGSSDYDRDLFPHILTSEQDQWSNHPRSTLLFRKFINNRQFLELYLNTQLDLLNTYLSENRVKQVIEEFRSVYEPEIGKHIQRWGYPNTISQWHSNIDLRVRFAENRPGQLRQHLINHFVRTGTITGQAVPLTIQTSNREHGIVRINSVELSPDTPGGPSGTSPWTGYYITSIPITLSAIPEPGYQFSHWTADGETLHGQQIKTDPAWYRNYQAHFVPFSNPVEENDDYELLHFWYFDTTIPNDTPLSAFNPTFSSSIAELARLTYQPAISPYPPEEGTEGIMDRVNDPTEINYLPAGNANLEYDEDEMRGIRARNPSKVNLNGSERESALIFDLPTTEFEDLVFSFAAHRTNSGQEQMVFHYSVNEGDPVWIQDELPMSFTYTSDEYSLYTLNFSGIESHRNNPHFKIRIGFDGENSTGDSGNTRFNNMSVHALPYTGPRIEDIEESRMEPNYPNPFNETTRVDYQIVRQTNIRLDLYDLTGRLVQSVDQGEREKGFYSAEINATGLSSGIYLLRLKTDDIIDVQKLLIIH